MSTMTPEQAIERLESVPHEGDMDCDGCTARRIANLIRKLAAERDRFRAMFPDEALWLENTDDEVRQ